MKLKPLYFLIGVLLLWSCSDNNDVTVQPVSITLNFSHSWNGAEITSANFPSTEFTNEQGTVLTISDVRYLISDIVLTHQSGVVTTLNEYNLIDVDDETGLSFTTSASILPGEYTNISFRFGFSEEDNTDEAYADLNTAIFNVPDFLGGGYHYMQLNGSYTNSSNVVSQYNFHVISAIDMSATNPTREDTSFVVDLGAVTVAANTNVNINADFFEWFSSPNTWDLNQFDTMLMGNYDAQIMMNANGQQGVFSLVDITQE